MLNQIGKYKIIRMLGKGAMGEVYLASHTRLKVTRALKILPAELSKLTDFRKRFDDEGSMLANLDHQNIVKVHDLDSDGEVHYIVMDFISPDGNRSQSLEDLLKERGRLSENETARILLQICDAISHAHDRGLIHRDIKPSNILLDKDGVVKVSDFGLAKMLGTDFLHESIARSGINIGGIQTTKSELSPSESRNTANGDDIGITESIGAKNGSAKESLVGTFQYMPPEVQGGGEWGKQGDVYSIGVLAYVMLTGTFPWGRWKDPSLLVENLKSNIWDDIVEKAMEPSLSRRYAKIEEIQELLIKEAEKLNLDWPEMKSQKKIGDLKISSKRIENIETVEQKKDEMAEKRQIKEHKARIRNQKIALALLVVITIILLAMNFSVIMRYALMIAQYLWRMMFLGMLTAIVLFAAFLFFQ